jgi:uncharacterized protein (DUF934 family)
MAVIKNQQLTDNTWHYVADDAPLHCGDITVSLERWLAEQAQLAQHSGQVGVRLQGSSDLNLIRPYLPKLPLIELEFPAFNDGRSFSQARLLRDREGYSGEIRAVGNFHADQVFYLHRVGFDSFELDDPKQQQAAIAAINDFDVVYQDAYR